MTDLVATLIARPANGDLMSAAARDLAAAVHASRTDELAPGEATDVFFASGEDIGTIRRRSFARVSPRGLDVVVQPVSGRRKKLLVADMDSTIIGQECIDELADFVGLKAHVAAITERAMRGEIEFEPALRERVALLKGLPAETIDTVIAERITLSPGAKTLVATMRAAGARAILVSGGFTLFTDRVARMVGFNENQANELVIEHGKLAGTVAEPILGRTAKLAALEDAIIRFGISAAETMAIGDGANDLSMIQRAGLGVAFHAKPKVAEAAAARIDRGDLTALLYVQGYRKAEFLEA
jgi:phosphoserine phosphatase